MSNKFNFWSVHGIMNTSGLLQVNVKPEGLHLLCIHDSMTIPKVEFIS